MNKHVFLLFLFFLLVACENREFQVANQQDVKETNAKLRQRLSEISNRYKIVSYNSVVRKTPLDERSHQSMTTTSANVQVAKSDMEGFAIGGGIGAILGGAGGTIGGAIVGAHYAFVGAGLGAVVGAAIGTFSGGVLFGIPYAVVWSIDKAKSMEEDVTTIAQYPYSLDVYNPINDFSNCRVLFSEDISYSNVGMFHNYIISSLYNTSGTSLFEISKQDIISYIFNNVFCANEGSDDSYLSVYECVQHRIEDDFSEYLSSVDTYSCMNDEIIQLYFDNLEEIQEDRWLAYTQDFMRVIDEELSFTENERVLQINGCLSTFMYSKYLWNTNAPNVQCGTYLVFNVEHENWSFVMWNDNIFDRCQMMELQGEENLIFVPQIEEGVLRSLFLYDELTLSNVTLSECGQFYEDGNEIYLSISEDIQVALSDTSFVTLPNGTHQFQRFDKGYFLVFNN